VVSTPLKNISQLGLLFPIYGKIKNVPNHQPDIYIYIIYTYRDHINKTWISDRFTPYLCQLIQVAFHCLPCSCWPTKSNEFCWKGHGFSTEIITYILATQTFKVGKKPWCSNMFSINMFYTVEHVLSSVLFSWILSWSKQTEPLENHENQLYPVTLGAQNDKPLSFFLDAEPVGWPHPWLKQTE